MIKDDIDTSRHASGDMLDQFIANTCENNFSQFLNQHVGVPSKRASAPGAPPDHGEV